MSLTPSAPLNGLRQTMQNAASSPGLQGFLEVYSSVYQNSDQNQIPDTLL